MTTTISASYQRKVQLEQYEPVTVSASFEREVDTTDAERVQAIYDSLYELAKDEVERKLAQRVADKREANGE